MARIGRGVGAEAAGDHHLAVLGDGLADRLQQFLPGADQKAAGVDHHDIGAVVARGDLVAFGAQPGDDALGIDQRLGAAEADEADARAAASGGNGRGVRAGGGWWRQA